MGSSTINAPQSQVFAALNLKQPTQDAQLNLFVDADASLTQVPTFD